jgi:hypothetical protein
MLNVAALAFAYLFAAWAVAMGFAGLAGGGL